MFSTLRVMVVLAVCGFALSIIFPSSASACSVIVMDHSQAALRQLAKVHVDRATAIVDGEVVRAFVEGK